jgi:acyl-ACP thioesterase
LLVFNIVDNEIPHSFANKKATTMNDDSSKIRSDRYLINWHEADFKGMASPATICNFLGESAWRQAEEQGFGYSDALRLNQFWVVLRWYIKMERYPLWQDEIIMETWPRMPEHLYAFRDYNIKSADGKILGKATSTWMVLDAKTRRPQKLELVKGLHHKTLDQKALNGNAGKIIIPDNAKSAGKIKVGYSQVDYNGHVTNPKYVEWALDLFNGDFHKSNFLSDLQINFFHECRFGDEVELFISHTDEQHQTVFGRNAETGQKIFAVELTWESQKSKI